MKKYESSIDLSVLPKNGKFIDWNNSIGIELNFTYGHIVGTVKIIDYVQRGRNKYVVLKYKDIEYLLQPTCVVQCSFGKMLKYELIEYRYDVGDVVITDKADITIIDRFLVKKETKAKSVNSHTQTTKRYKYRCNKCGYEDVRDEHKLARACKACYKIPRKVVVGINDIPTTHPWMVPYFLGGAEEASKYNARSNKRVYMKCPYCNSATSTKRSINTLFYRKGLSCECGDGISYPNKFSYQLLKQLPVKHVTHEWQPDWLKPYFYDNYFEYNGKSYVLEMDGNIGHGNYIFNNHKAVDIDGLNKDIYKDSLSEKHNVCVIRVDARQSELDYIKNGIMSSKLKDLFDLSQIDWNKCDEFAYKNIVKEACEYKANNPKVTTSELVKRYGLNRLTIGKYLRIGNKFGWCKYDPNWNKGYIAFRRCSKPIICNDRYIFDSLSTLYDKSEDILGVKISHRGFYSTIKEDSANYKGVTFRYLNKAHLNDYLSDDNYVLVKNKNYG